MNKTYQLKQEPPLTNAFPTSTTLVLQRKKNRRQRNSLLEYFNKIQGNSTVQSYSKYLFEKFKNKFKFEKNLE